MEESWEREHSRKRKAGLGFQQGGTDQAEEAARHYNKLHDRHRSLTGGSDILTLRNLHNWIKSVLIARHMRSGASVLDLACGKGGDMLKFKVGGCARYVGVDIAIESVRDAVGRYNGAHGRQPMPFEAFFYAADFADAALAAALPTGLLFHLVSCQFALHYSFSSEERAAALLANVSSRLLPGAPSASAPRLILDASPTRAPPPRGIFLGTTADANVLVRRLRASEGLSFGNPHYRAVFPPEAASKAFPPSQPFGHSYRFTLQEAVDDCREFLVPMGTLRALAASHGRGQ
ncbi:hypothetical protein EMIHUDRAFT_73968 [Emiliania huxleyi CCMP1516]|uniref:mRNA (guanine-N(7))-methyltransferase n=2 Tax=Emiliania huxleyi TaxID=2903 RepID=A0A0D3JND1_EMIH1|nr:hypothetical protein EMIHUDRAFT_73968 [Emiliania huxleyi CCMP1516]EOD25016.1 hypothetical protein EMIHUDRAFT_73968 [Emiliania huxleyi CCMP1516]|eukprot:XP_005777445.1 hypothetical protein EMIHUDRAFT_73968 [Emiliania huxleyi CCMP1516]